MKSGICPKCKNSEIYYQKGVQNQSEIITLKQGIISKGAFPDRYICGSCGYVEFYLSQEKDLKIVVDNWDKVVPKQ